MLPTREEAEVWLASELARVDRGEQLHASNERQTLESWLRDFYSNYRIGPTGQKLSARTCQTDWTSLELYLLRRSPALANTPLAKVSTALLARHFSKLSSANLSRATVSRVFRILKARLAFAVKLGKLKFNPARTDTVPVDGKPPREHRTLTFVQAQALLEVCHTSKHGTYFATLAWTGLRPGEAAGLTWRDVDFENGTLAIRRALVRTRPGAHQNGEGASWSLDTTKTKKSRSVPIPASLVSLLQHHKRMQAQARLIAGAEYRYAELVFATDFGQPLTLDSLVPRYFHPLVRAAALHLAGETPLPLPPPSRSAAYKTALDAREEQQDRAIALTEFPMLSLYDLRHTQATLLLRRGVHPKIVADRLGHSKTSTTLDIYSHVAPDLQREALDVLELGLSLGARKGA